MEIGDLVRCDLPSDHHTGQRTGIGVVIKLKYAKARNPDYRTPDSALVYLSEEIESFKWFYKSELQLIT